MDPFHLRLARIALDAAAPYGFCLAGGYAVQAHGFVDRLSKDVDLFTTTAAESDFPRAQAAVAAALRRDGLEVTVEREGPSFARLAVVDPVGGDASTVELGVDWRAYSQSSSRSGQCCIPPMRWRTNCAPFTAAQRSVTTST